MKTQKNNKKSNPSKKHENQPPHLHETNTFLQSKKKIQK